MLCSMAQLNRCSPWSLWNYLLILGVLLTIVGVLFRRADVVSVLLDAMDSCQMFSRWSWCLLLMILTISIISLFCSFSSMVFCFSIVSCSFRIFSCYLAFIYSLILPLVGDRNFRLYFEEWLIRSNFLVLSTAFRSFDLMELFSRVLQGLQTCIPPFLQFFGADTSVCSFWNI